MRKSLKLCLFAPALALGLAGCSGADQPEIVKTREANFKKFGAAAKAIKQQLDSGSPSFEEIAPHVANLVTLSPDIPTWFPEGTSEGTEALPAIWEKPDEFAARAKDLSDAAAKLQAAVDANDAAALGAAFGETGKSCKGCHDTFREKDD